MSVAKLTVVVPCYNEQATINAVVEKVLVAPRHDLPIEVIIVDDGSTDASGERIAALAATHGAVRAVSHDRNRGKGAALKTGFALAEGDIVLVQDADLEYDPEDYAKLLAPLLDDRADVVYGSRFIGGEAHRVLYFWHSVGNRVLTLMSNMFNDLNLSDMETCYKVFRRPVIEALEIRESRFGFEPEITAKICRMRPRPRIYEVGVSYFGRTYQEGKKVGWRDGLRALYCIVRYRIFD